jgi:hypothetical protein
VRLKQVRLSYPLIIDDSYMAAVETAGLSTLQSNVRIILINFLLHNEKRHICDQSELSVRTDNEF